MAQKTDEWKSLKDAARQTKRGLATIYRWMDLPEAETGIRRMKPERTVLVHMPSLLDYEATIKIGRPRRQATDR